MRLAFLLESQQKRRARRIYFLDPDGPSWSCVGSLAQRLAACRAKPSKVCCFGEDEPTAGNPVARLSVAQSKGKVEAVLRCSRRRRLTRLVRAIGPCNRVARLSAARAGERSGGCIARCFPGGGA